MAEVNENKPVRRRRIRHTDRGNQVFIYLGKQFRFFINESDWKVLPMAAVIAALVGMVINKNFCVNMEGCLFGGFALTCVAIWNGCFNSIQAVCRERAIIKREHRSGMHISSYVTAHMIYQFLLCMAQTGLTMYVLLVMGVQFPEKGVITPWMIVDMGLSLLLISYASDMLSLLISSISRTTTGAMTIMPFVLIFQLVFSGGMLTLPEWTAPLKNLTISSPGLNVIAAQGDYNKRPLVAIWNRVQSMGNVEIGGEITMGQVLDYLDEDTALARQIREEEISGTFTVGQVLDFLADDSNPMAQELRGIELGGTLTVDELLDMLLDGVEAAEQDGAALNTKQIGTLIKNAPALRTLRAQRLDIELTLGELIDMASADGSLEAYRGNKLNFKYTVGQLKDLLEASGDLEALRARSFPVKMTIAELQSRIGVEAVRSLLQDKAAEGSVNPAYANTRENIALYWVRLLLFVLIFAAFATVTLEFIDKDKR